LSLAINHLKRQIHIAGDHASPWNVYNSEDVDVYNSEDVDVYNSEDVDEFIKRVLKIFYPKKVMVEEVYAGEQLRKAGIKFYKRISNKKHKEA